jgi:toxin ParE1/3/4
MRRFALSPRAQADLDEIWDYSATRWGVLQSEAYVRLIQTAMQTLAASPGLGRTCDAIRRGYRRHPAGSHVIFYRQHGGIIEIIRILHQRMDVGSHL